MRRTLFFRDVVLDAKLFDADLLDKICSTTNQTTLKIARLQDVARWCKMVQDRLRWIGGDHHPEYPWNRPPSMILTAARLFGEVAGYMMDEID